jgi:two-component system OmpR family sensor kinase
VAEADRERIFDRFVRLSDSRSGGGTGLGLPISRAIIRAAGGDLRCLPWRGGGCFEVLLPIAVPAVPVRPLQLTG